MCWFSGSCAEGNRGVSPPTLPPFICNNHLSKHPQTHLTVCTHIGGRKKALHPFLSGTVCSNNSEKDQWAWFLWQDEARCFFYISIPGQHRRHESAAKRGPFEKIAFQAVNVCGWTHRGQPAGRTFTPQGQGSAVTTSTNGPKSRIMAD